MLAGLRGARAELVGALVAVSAASSRGLSAVRGGAARAAGSRRGERSSAALALAGALLLGAALVAGSEHQRFGGKACFLCACLNGQRTKELLVGLFV